MSLVHGDLIKYFKTKLHSEIEFIMKVLIENGYPLDLEQSIVCAKIPQVNKPTLHRLEKYHQFAITVDYVSSSIFIQLTACLHYTTYGGIHTRRCSASSHHFSSEIYNYKCQCNDEYIGRSNKRLETRIEQYVPSRLINTYPLRFVKGHMKLCIRILILPVSRSRIINTLYDL